MKNILLTRPKQQSQDLAAFLENAGFATFIEPLFSVKKNLPAKKPTREITAIIITSANACDAVINFELEKNLPVFSVGKKTAEKLIAAGFYNIVTAENSAESLKELIIKKADKAGEILYFHGSEITLDFKKALEPFNFSVQKILAYETFASENFSAEFLEISQQKTFDQVLLFSQNSAKIFFKLAARHNLLEYFATSQILCLSEKILSDVKKFGFTNSTTFAEFPILKKFYD